MSARTLRFATLLVISALACSGGPATDIVNPPPPKVVSVEVSPTSVVLDAGGTAVLAVTPRDGAGKAISGKQPSFASSNTSIASVSSDGIVTAVAVGGATINVTVDGVSTTANVTVVAPPAANTVQIFPSVTYQTMVAWQALAGIGDVECNQTAYANYRTGVLDRAVTELGLNGISLPLPSGMENTVDWFAQRAQFSEGALNQHLYNPVNDNSDPSSANAAGYQWSYLDHKIDDIINPLRQRLAARGEHLFVRAHFEDPRAVAKTIEMMLAPPEYAEFMTEAFKHMQQKYGWVPDVLDIMNEPDLPTSNPYTPAQITAAGAAAIARLRANGFSSVMVAGPSSNFLSNGPVYFDVMRQNATLAPAMAFLTYHRYQGNTGAAEQAVHDHWIPGQIGTMMTEYLYATYNDLWRDLTLLNASGWEQFGLASCGPATNPTAQGIYYQINQSDAANPIITLTYAGRAFRQVFLYVREGAERVRAASGSPSVIDAIAFRNSNGKFVAVVRSLNGAASFTVKGLPAGTYGIKFYVAGQASDVDLNDVTIGSGGDVVSAIPGTGLLTIYSR